jgi:hypothetical protein
MRALLVMSALVKHAEDRLDPARAAARTGTTLLPFPTSTMRRMNDDTWTTCQVDLKDSYGLVPPDPHSMQDQGATAGLKRTWMSHLAVVLIMMTSNRAETWNPDSFL